MKKWLRKITIRIKKRLERFAEKNREYHGGRRLDCCSGNKRPAVNMKRE